MAARTFGIDAQARPSGQRRLPAVPAGSRMELVCAHCLYGVVVSEPPERCPMCGSGEWLPSYGSAVWPDVRRPESPPRAADPVGRTTTIRIDAPSRWDALALTRELPRCDWFLVAHAGDRWEVCVRAAPRRRRLARDVVDAARSWAARRRLDTVVHLPGRDLELEGTGSAADR